MKMQTTMYCQTALINSSTTSGNRWKNVPSISDLETKAIKVVKIRLRKVLLKLQKISINATRFAMITAMRAIIYRL